MIRWNDCEKCPYYSSYIPYYSEDGCLVEDCGAGCNPEEGCRHNRLVRFILHLIQEYKLRKWLKHEEQMLKEMEEPDEEI